MHRLRHGSRGKEFKFLPGIRFQRAFHPPRRTSLTGRSPQEKFLAKIFYFAAASMTFFGIARPTKKALSCLFSKSEDLLRIGKPLIERGISLSHLCRAKIGRA